MGEQDGQASEPNGHTDVAGFGIYRDLKTSNAPAMLVALSAGVIECW